MCVGVAWKRPNRGNIVSNSGAAACGEVPGAMRCDAMPPVRRSGALAND